MKRIAITVFSLSCIAAERPQEAHPIENLDLPEVKNEAFAPGEVLEYRLHYGIINAGTAKLEVKKSKKKVRGREVLHIVGTGRSRGAFDLFFKVRDRYETYIDQEGMFPWAFVRRVSEGGYEIKQDYTFFQEKNIVDNGKGKKFEVPVGIQDMLSGFYYARTMDFSNAEIGDLFTLQSFVDDEVYPMSIKFMGWETIKGDMGKFKCLKFVPVVQEGRIFEKEEDLMVWITDDKNKIPVLARAKVLVGSIKMDLTNYEGLANPVALVEN